MTVAMIAFMPRQNSQLSLQIVQRIKWLRMASGWKRRHLEINANLPRGHATKIEDGPMGQDLSVETVARIADALGVPVGLLITGRREEHRVHVSVLVELPDFPGDLAKPTKLDGVRLPIPRAPLPAREPSTASKTRPRAQGQKASPTR